jgi:hypothetical protein
MLNMCRYANCNDGKKRVKFGCDAYDDNDDGIDDDHDYDDDDGDDGNDDDNKIDDYQNYNGD